MGTVNKFTVIRDTQEQKGWQFKKSKFCTGTIQQKLPTGDYTLQGYEDVFIIERKGTTAEVAKNINEARFERELERLEQFQYPFMLLEFNMEDVISFPKNSGIPFYLWKKLRVTSSFLLRKLLEYQFLYKTRIIFCGNEGPEVAKSIFKRIIAT